MKKSEERSSGILPVKAVFIILIGAHLGCSDRSPNENVNSRTGSPVSQVATIEKNKNIGLEKAPQNEPLKEQFPDEGDRQELVKKTLMEFNKALEQEDFNDFYETISESWQKQITPEQLNQRFAGLIDRRMDLSSINLLEAEFTKQPEIGQKNDLRTLLLEGKYDTTPAETNFKLEFVEENKEWKLSAIRIVEGKPVK